MNNTIIDSKNPEFEEILREALFGYQNTRGLNGARDHYKWRLSEHKDSFNKISQTLGSKLRKI